MAVTKKAKRAKPKQGPKIPWAVIETFLHETDARLNEITKHAAKATDEASLGIYFALQDFDSKWSKTQGKLLDELGHFKAVERRAHTATDTARVKAHLAKADALDAVDSMLNRIRKIERRLHAFKVQAESAGVRALKRL